METLQQNGRFTLFSTKFHSNIYSILFNIFSWLPFLTKKTFTQYNFNMIEPLQIFVKHMAKNLQKFLKLNLFAF